MKFGGKVHVSENIRLNCSQISWIDKNKHLGNYINQSLLNKLNRRYTVSLFIGSATKLKVNLCRLMLLLDYLNHIVVYSMVVKHGVLILHGISVYEIFLSCPIPLTLGC